MFDFYPRDAMLAQYLLSSLVRLSVRLSQGGILSKRLNTGSQKQRLTIDPGLYFYDAKNIYEIPMRSPPTGAPNSGAVGKNAVFRPVKKYSAHTLYHRKFVSIRNGSPRSRPCAGGGMRDIINNIRGSRS